jgi:hypothetical protein
MLKPFLFLFIKREELLNASSFTYVITSSNELLSVNVLTNARSILFLQDEFVLLEELPSLSWVFLFFHKQFV